MDEQIFTIGRDIEFSIYLQDAAGAAINIAGQQFRLRIYPKAGSGAAPIVDLPFGSGVSIGSGSGGRIDIVGGTLSASDPSYGAVDLTRTDTGADLVHSWPCRIAREGTALGEGGDIILRTPASLVLKIAQTAPGIQGAQGVAGPSSLVAGSVPLIPNGGFNLWARGNTGFGGASALVCEGWRFSLAGGGTHTIQRGNNLSDSSWYSLQWDRSGSAGNSYVEHALEDIRRFHNQTLTLAWLDKGDAAIDYMPRVRWNYGTGGSPESIVNLGAKVAGTGVALKTATISAVDLSALTVASDAVLGIQFLRRAGDPNGQIKISEVRLYIGSTDFGFLSPELAMQSQMAKRRLQVIQTRTINGTTRVYFPVEMRAAPAVTASAGTVTNITATSLDLTHTSAAATTLTLDAEP